jgi:hypothetical protein
VRKKRFLVIWIEKKIGARKGKSKCRLFFKDFLKMGGIKKEERRGVVS